MRGFLLLCAALFLSVAIVIAKGTHPLVPWLNLAVGVLVMLAAIFSLAAADTPGDDDYA